jgi:hypothetical protein
VLVDPRVFRRLCCARDLLSGDGSLSIREVAAEVGISQLALRTHRLSPDQAAFLAHCKP